MRAGISTIDLNPASLIQMVRTMPAPADPVSEVTTDEPRVIPTEIDKQFTVAVLDLGVRATATTLMARRGMEVHLFPASTPFDDIMEASPDGIVFAGGPGDPSTLAHPIEMADKIIAEGIPFFGIGLGVQVFGLALGFPIERLKHGHYGLNQPVKDLSTGKVRITTHGHGYAIQAPAGVELATPYGVARVSHVHVNDHGVEGLELRHDGMLAGFGVQFHPESGAGTHDSAYLFDQFATMMSVGRRNA